MPHSPLLDSWIGEEDGELESVGVMDCSQLYMRLGVKCMLALLLLLVLGGHWVVRQSISEGRVEEVQGVVVELERHWDCRGLVSVSRGGRFGGWERCLRGRMVGIARLRG